MGDGAVIFSSGSVAAGAAIDSGVLNLKFFKELLALVDNTAGTVLRDLTLNTYLDDGTTLIDSVVLRRCAYGTAPTGSVYAPGAIRGYVGPNPPGGMQGVHILYDATSAVNAALDTGPIDIEGMDAVDALAEASAGTTQIALSRVRDDGTIVTLNTTLAGPATVVAFSRAYPYEASGSSNNTALGAVAFVAGRRAKWNTVAAGAGNTVRLVVTASGRVPGTFSHQMVLPTRARLQLAAGGAGAARLTVIGR